MTLAIPARDAGDGLARRWARLSLATRFATAAGVVLALAALAIGSAVTARIETTVVRNAAQATTLYIDSIIAPISQQLEDGDRLSPGARRALEEILASATLGGRVASFKFWSMDGEVIWADDKSIVGRTFAVTPELARAMAGEVVASFDDLGDDEDAREAALGVPLLEIYAPVREVYSGRVIAVAEFYEVASALSRDLAEARRGAWAWVGAATLGLGAVLYLIVLEGSRTIEAQRAALDQRLGELRGLSARNEELRLRVQGAAARAAAAADRTMRRIGADLHDGPAQHLAYAALRLDALRGRLAGHSAEEDLVRVAEAVSQAMAEVRALSRGLQLPDVADRPLLAVVEAAVSAHEARTGHRVDLRMDCAAATAADPAVKLCAYRFAQEGLGNASRHAGGAGLELEMACRDGVLRMAVRDRGPGLPPSPGARGGMGLSGLRDRVESLGGTFLARDRRGGGAEITMNLDLGGGP